ncbi:MAG: hypothetical protein HZB18_08050 [Chloroflexi bacterium]|nr:hypothetical protein [Chloroflexota bacterium]
MRRKKILFGFALFFVALLALSLSSQTKAEKLRVLVNQQESLVDYLKKELGQLDVPVQQTVILQDSPLEIGVTIQSLSTNEKFAPDDFVYIHMVFRESMFAHEKGYQINGLTTIVVNMEEKKIFDGWSKIEPASMSYRRLDPPRLTETSTSNMLSEKLADYGLSKINVEVISSEESRTLNLYLSNISKEEASATKTSIKDSLGLLVQDMNSQGAGVAIVKLKITNESGETLLNYLLDLQFVTEGWWVADGINVDDWFPSRPAMP